MNLTKGVVCFFLVLLSVAGGVYLIGLLILPSDGEEETQDWIQTYLDWYYPTVLVSLCAGLITTSFVLIYNMGKYFDKRLKEEMIRIEVTLLIFTIAYLTRAATYVITQILIVGEDSFRETMTFYVSYLFWDVIPLTLIMRFHGNNIKKPTDPRYSTTSESFRTESIESTISGSPDARKSLKLTFDDELAILGNPEYTKVLI